MDPTSIFSIVVLEQIFCQLSAKDLKKCLIVSKTWNNLIEASAQCLQNVKLRVGSIGSRTEYTIDDLKTITRHRKYQHVFFSKLPELEPEWIELIFNILNSNRRWKTIQLYGIIFPSSSSFFKLVESFDETVEKLHFHKIEIRNPNKESKNFKFNKLKLLEWFTLDRRFQDNATIIADLFQNCSSLVSLSFADLQIDLTRSEDFQLSIRRLFAKQEHLKEFCCDRNFINMIFSANDPSSFPMQLEELFIYGDFGVSYAQDYCKSFIEFLKLQKFIKRFKIWDEFENENIYNLLSIVFGMKSVKDVAFFYVTGVALQEKMLPISQSIEKLTLMYVTHSQYIEVTSSNFLDFLVVDVNPTLNREKVKYFLKSTPKAKAIDIPFIDEDLAKFIAENLKDLQTCERFLTLDADVLQEILPKVKLSYRKFSRNKLIPDGL